MVPSIPNRVELDGSHTVRIKAVFNSGTGKLLNVSMEGGYVATPM